MMWSSSNAWTSSAPEFEIQFAKTIPPKKKKLDVGNLDFLSSLNQNRIQPPVLSARRFQCSCREEFQTSRSKDPNEFSQSDLSRQMKGPCAMAFHSFFMVCRATFFTRILTHLCVCTILRYVAASLPGPLRSTKNSHEFLDEANLPSSRAASVQRCWSPPPSQHGPAYRLLGTSERTIVTIVNLKTLMLQVRIQSLSNWNREISLWIWIESRD